MLVRKVRYLIGIFSRYGNYPTDTKTVGQHPKTRREEGPGQRHTYLAAIGERGEDAVSLSFGLHGQR